MRPSVLVAGALLTLVLLTWIAPMFAPYDPRLSSGRPLLSPERDHLLGTKDIGQDVLSEWLWGARATLLIALLVTLLSTALSWTIGLAAGMWRGVEWPLLGLTGLPPALGIVATVLAATWLATSPSLATTAS